MHLCILEEKTENGYKRYKNSSENLSLFGSVSRGEIERETDQTFLKEY